MENTEKFEFSKMVITENRFLLRKWRKCVLPFDVLYNKTSMVIPLEFLGKCFISLTGVLWLKCFIPWQKKATNVSYPGRWKRQMFHTPAGESDKCFIPRNEILYPELEVNNEQPLILKSKKSADKIWEYTQLLGTHIY